MLAIRMQRTGRSGHAQFRVIVQDSRAHPKRGRVVAYLGNYDPHTKVAQLDTDQISTYLSGGAQPSDRVAKLLKKEGVKLPAWVTITPDKKRAIRNPAKLRRNAPPGEKPESADEGSVTSEAEKVATEAPESAGEERTENPVKEPAAAEEPETASEELAAESQPAEPEKAAKPESGPPEASTESENA